MIEAYGINHHEKCVRIIEKGFPEFFGWRLWQRVCVNLFFFTQYSNFYQHHVDKNLKIKISIHLDDVNFCCAFRV